jgi:hypothetical protein
MIKIDFIGGQFEIQDGRRYQVSLPVSENVWFETKIKRFYSLEPEICKSKIFNGRHFENPKWPP